MKKYRWVIVLILLVIIVALSAYFAGVYFKSKGTKAVTANVTPTPTIQASQSASITETPGATSPTITEAPTETPTLTPTPAIFKIFPGFFKAVATATPSPTPKPLFQIPHIQKAP